MALSKNKHIISLKQALRVCAALGTLIMIAAVYNRLHLVTHCTFIIDPRLTQETQLAIEQFVYQNNWRTHPHALPHLLTAHFSCIQAVSTHLTPPSNLEIAVTAENPMLAVNNSHIITQNGKVIPDHYFLRQRVVELPAIRMRTISVDTLHVPDALRTFLAALTPHLLEQYAVTIESDTEIRLHDIYNPFTILCCATTQPQQHILDQCNRIMRAALAQEVEKKKGNKGRFLADIRFDKQIILSQEKKGVHYG